MSNDISRSAVLQINIDGNNAKGTIEEINQAFGRAALKGTGAFKEISSSVDVTIVKVDSSISAFDRFIRTVENSSKRASAAKWVEGLDNVEAELARIQSRLSATATSTSFDAMSADAAQLAANLDKVQQQLTKINALKTIAQSQAAVANVISGGAETARYQQWLATNADPSIQGYRTTQLYDIDLSNATSLRNEDELIRYKQWLANNADPSIQGYRTTQLYDIDLSNATSLRNNANEDELIRYKRWFMEKEQTSPPKSYNPNVSDAEAMVTHQSYLADREQKRAEANQRDSETRDKMLRERQAEHDRLLSLDPTGPNYYDSKYRDELTNDFKRDKWVRDNREHARRSQMGSINLLDETDLNNRYQKWDETHGNQGAAKKRFIGQQLAFAADDASQQFMWSSSTGAGISAAARAAGNNLSAVAANMDMSTPQMMGVMLAVQGVSALTSYIGKMSEETLKAAKNTEVLEKSISRFSQSTDRASKFGMSLRRGDAKTLQADQEDSDAELDAVNKKLAMVRQLQNPQARMMSDNKPTNSWGEWIAQGWGLYGLGPTESARRYTAYEGAKAKNDKLSGEANELAIEKKILEEERVKRTAELTRKRASESRRSARQKKGKILSNKFDMYVDEYEDITGVSMSGEQIQEAYDFAAIENPDADLSSITDTLDERKRRADYRIRSGQRQANKYFEDIKSVEDFNKSVKDNPFGELLRDFNDFVKEVNDQKYLDDSKKRELISAKEADIEERIGKKKKDISDDMRQAYRPNEGITSGSIEDTELKAKLTALTDDPNGKDQTELLRQIADNTKPKQAPPDKVVDLGEFSSE